MSRIHYTRNWQHPVCNRALDCDERAVVSDPALLAAFHITQPCLVCRNCDRLMTSEERQVRDRKIFELLSARPERRKAVGDG